jgi:uncharacterized membrane protein YkoI
MKIILSLAALVLAPSAVWAADAPAKTYVGHELAGRAQINRAQAEGIALKARPGQIIDRELEKEAGGSGLRWSFDIKAKEKTYEVGVDAANGKVLENLAEVAHRD